MGNQSLAQIKVSCGQNKQQKHKMVAEAPATTVDGNHQEILHQLIGSLSHYLQGFSTIPGGLAGFLNHQQYHQCNIPSLAGTQSMICCKLASLQRSSSECPIASAKLLKTRGKYFTPTSWGIWWFITRTWQHEKTKDSKHRLRSYQTQQQEMPTGTSSRMAPWSQNHCTHYSSMRQLLGGGSWLLSQSEFSYNTGITACAITPSQKNRSTGIA